MFPVLKQVKHYTGLVGPLHVLQFETAVQGLQRRPSRYYPSGQVLTQTFVSYTKYLFPMLKQAKHSEGFVGPLHVLQLDVDIQSLHKSPLR